MPYMCLTLFFITITLINFLIYSGIHHTTSSWMVLVIMDLRNNVFFVSDMELPAYEHPPLWIPPNEVFLNSNNA